MSTLLCASSVREIFGPVVCVTPFDEENNAIELANATSYGLAAYIWTRDLGRAHRVAHAVEAGMTWVSSHNVRDLRTPFGGIKASADRARRGAPRPLTPRKQAAEANVGADGFSR